MEFYFMRRILALVICLSIIFISCNENPVDAALDAAELNMEEKPECSLEILEKIEKGQLSKRRQKARYSLLYSIALDKNYIDIKSDSIISPAVDYYRTHGSRAERFDCYYYLARIYENVQDQGNVLLNSAKAESLDTSKIDPYKLCLLYAMKGNVYHQAWRIQDAIDSYTLACKYAIKAEKFRHYAYFSLMLAESYRYAHNLDASIQSVSDAYSYNSYFTLNETHLYHRLMLLNMMDTNTDPQECLSYAENYIKEYPQENKIYWNIIAEIYLNSGYPEHAYESLKKYPEHFNVQYGYYGILSRINESRGDYIGALDAYRKFSEYIKERDVTRHKSNVKLIEERYKNEFIQSRQKHLIIYFATFAILILCITLYLNIKWRKERKLNQSNLAELQQEYDALCMLKEHLDGANKYLCEQVAVQSSTDQELLRVLGHRMKSLSAFLQKPIPDSLSKVVPQIENLRKSKNYIVDNIGLLYAVTYPDFVSELRMHDLTSSEIGYCCLLLLGLNIPEAGEVIGRVSSIYNVNSSIRKKLGVTSQNLDKWLINRFSEYYPDLGH